jgi:uncharacterized OB-fold protein
MTEIGSTPMAIEVAYGKPVPAPDEASRPFFQGTLRGEIVLQRCGACRFWMWPVRVRCIDCFSDDLTWEAASGTGTLYSFTIVHQVVHPGFAEDVPYNVAMVDLREGVRIIASVTAAAADLRIGMPLVVDFDHITDTVALPRFRPATAGS